MGQNVQVPDPKTSGQNGQVENDTETHPELVRFEVPDRLRDFGVFPVAQKVSAPLLGRFFDRQNDGVVVAVVVHGE